MMVQNSKIVADNRFAVKITGNAIAFPISFSLDTDLVTVILYFL